MMKFNSMQKARVKRSAAAILLTFCFFQHQADAQSSTQTSEYVRIGATVLVGLARGEVLRYTAFNPEPAEGRGEAIRMQMRLFDDAGKIIAESAQVVIPPGESRSVEVKRNDIEVAGDHCTGHMQVRASPLWGLRTLDPITVSTSLEVKKGDASKSTFKPLRIKEALP